MPMELEKPTGPVHHGGSSGSGIQRDDAPRTGATRNADARPLEATDVEMNAEDPCAAQVKRAKTIMGLEKYVLEALDDVFDEPPETPTNLAGTLGENETNEDVVSPEVTEELNRLKTLGRPYTAPSADELMPRTFVYSQKTNEQLNRRMVAEGRERELGGSGRLWPIQFWPIHFWPIFFCDVLLCVVVCCCVLLLCVVVVCVVVVGCWCWCWTLRFPPCAGPPTPDRPKFHSFFFSRSHFRSFCVFSR